MDERGWGNKIIYIVGSNSIYLVQVLTITVTVTVTNA